MMSDDEGGGTTMPTDEEFATLLMHNARLLAALVTLRDAIVSECGDPDEAEGCDLLDAVREADRAIASGNEA